MSPTAPDAQPPSQLVPATLLIACLMVLAVAIWLVVTIRPAPDLLWRLHLAEGMLAGKQLYRDMIEVNPPLWFWAALPAVWLAQLLQAQSYLVLIGLNFALACGSAALFYRLVRESVSQLEAGTLAVTFLAGLCLIPVGDWGQREQALLAACGLWSALMALRVLSRPVPTTLAVMVGLIAAYGFALKHYFVLIPIVLEVWLMVQRRRVRHILRPETVVLGGAAIVYAGCVFVLTPDFLGRVLGLVQTAYYGFGPWNSLSPLDRHLRLLAKCGFVLLPMLAFVFSRQRPPLAVALLLSILAACVIVILQQKGWRYHMIAAQGLSVVLLAFLLVAGWRERLGVVRKIVLLGCTLTAGWTCLAKPIEKNLATGGHIVAPTLARLMASEPNNSRIFVLSTAPELAFYPLAKAGRPYWSRHYSMWMMPGLLTQTADPARERVRVAELSRVRGEFIADLTCSVPDLIVGEVGYFRNPDRRLFDAMGFLTKDAGFRAWLDTYYSPQMRFGRYPIWRLKGPRPAPCQLPA